MQFNKEIKVLRIIEQSVLFIFVVVVFVGAGLFVVDKMSSAEFYIVSSLLMLLILALVFIQKKINASYAIALAQVNYSNTDAFDSLYERSPVAYLTINPAGTVVGYNGAAIKLLQSQADMMMGLDFFSLINSDEDTDASLLVGKIKAGVTTNDVEVAIKTLNKGVVWVMLSVFKQRNESVVSMVNVTEQKRVDTAKSEFVALATHQLRTPIAAIRWNTELLSKNLKDSKTEKQDKYLVKIERNVLRMINLINDFLSVSKLEMGTFSTNKEDIKVSVFLDSVIDEFAEKIAEKSISLQRNGIPADVTIKTDSRLLHVIVSNLVSNAVKYLAKRGTLTLGYELKGDSLELVVADDGIGIPQAEIDNLFTKFFRASNAQSHQTEGTGLGLYVVKQSVELLGGTLKVESAEDQGAKFIVTLPVSVVAIKEIG